MQRDSLLVTLSFLSGMFRLPAFLTITCSLFFSSPSNQIVSFWLILCLIALSGMTITSFCWEFVGQIGHKLSCRLLSYACIPVFLLQLLMLLRQIAGLQFSTTQGRTSIITYFLGVFLSNVLTFAFAGQALQSLSYRLQSMLRLCIIPVYLWGCVSGCFLRQKSLVLGGKFKSVCNINLVGFTFRVHFPFSYTLSTFED